MAYEADWDSGGFKEMAEAFSLSEKEAREVSEGFEVLHAYYSYEDYSGLAFVILRSRADGGLWEVNGSHCSCHGLEGQWDPEPTMIEALISRQAARELPGIDAHSGGAWLRSLVDERELSDACPDPLRPSPRKIAL